MVAFSEIGSARVEQGAGGWNLTHQTCQYVGGLAADGGFHIGVS